MAVPSLHAKITAEVLTELGFGAAGLDKAVKANVAVDDRQGDTADETNLHAMRGFKWTGGAMQTEDEAQAAVGKLLSQRLDKIKASILSGKQHADAAKKLQSPQQTLPNLQAQEELRKRDEDWITAFEELGRALHTIQDAAFHHFEPWPFTSIVDAVLNPHKAFPYGMPSDWTMLSHGARDLANISIGNFDTGIGISYLDYGAVGGTGLGTQAWADLEVTKVIDNKNWWVPSAVSAGVSGWVDTNNRPALGGGGLLTITWGAPRGGMDNFPRPSDPPRSVLRNAPQEGRQHHSRVAEDSAHGIISMLAAQKNSKAWVQDELQKLITQVAVWQEWITWSPFQPTFPTKK
jgi:hypothetical protein